MTYLIKRLQSQELGSVTAKNPKPSRGRYLFVSKNSSYLEHLPHLSKTILNDFIILTLVPLYKQHFERCYCTFVYNNDKYHPEIRSGKGQPRDEMRIYSNKSLENNKLLFKKDDILILKPQKIQFKNALGNVEEETLYFTYLVQNLHSDLYKELDNLIKTSPLRGNYAVSDKPIIEVEKSIEVMLKNNDFNSPQGSEESALEVTDTITNLSNRSNTSIESLFTHQSIFRDFVQAGYEGRCAITGQVIRCGNFNNLQAAHIKPKSHNGQYTPNNGILMNRDMHWAFDTGCFTINDNFTIRVHPSVESDFLQSLDGKKILIPKQDFFKPDIKNLNYHQEHIYGTFTSRGRVI